MNQRAQATDSLQVAGAPVLAISNQKGGVGKTTTAINLSAALAAAGYRVLLVDMDPQGNASTGLGLAHATRSRGTYALLSGASSLADVVVATTTPKLSIVPSEPQLAGAEIELVSQTGREFRLRNALRGQSLFDFILVDCPPSLGLLTLNGLVAAHSVLVPLQCEFFALEGLSQLTRTLELVRNGPNAELRLQGILLTMFDRRNNLSELVAADARGFFGTSVYQTVIPRNVRISEASSHGIPLFAYDSRSSGALAYSRLADELLQQFGKAGTVDA